MAELAGLTISQQLGAFVANLRFSELPAEVVEDARWRFVDQMGNCLAGSRERSADLITRFAASTGGREEATALRLGTRLPAPLAGWVNGALGHISDYDDMNGLAGVRISTVAVPAALAMAERQGATGEECILGMVAGGEIGIRILTGVPPHQFHRRGIQGTGLAGPFTAAAVGSKLLRAGSAATANALGLAGSQAGGLLQSTVDGTWAKHLHPAYGVQAGLTDSLLALEGFTGPSEVIEGKFGFFRALMYGGEQAFQFGNITEGLGTRWVLPETTFKPYPTGSWNQSSMDAVAIIMRRDHLDVGQIERIECIVPPVCIPIVCEPIEQKRRPRTTYHMKFSLPYSVAMVAVLGDIRADDFNEEVLANEAILEVAARVECVADPSMPLETFPARAVVHTLDGRRLEQDMPAWRGGPGNRMTPEDLRKKFRLNAEPSLGVARSNELLQAIEEISDALSVTRIMKLANAAGV